MLDTIRQYATEQLIARAERRSCGKTTRSTSSYWPKRRSRSGPDRSRPAKWRGWNGT